MPALYSLAQHEALVEADGKLLPSEQILSFLDDLYVDTTRERAHEAYIEVADTVHRRAGVRSNLGKLQAWSSGRGPPPPEFAALWPGAWKADRDDSENGLKILGTPLGRPAFVAQFAQGRVAAEQQLLDQIVFLPDLQCAWLMLSMSATPRANHMIRMIPPPLSKPYARWHDDAL